VTAATFDPVKRSPSHHQHAVLGARFARDAGWDVPADYGSVEAERRAVTEGAAVADVTARGKVDLRGDVSGAVSNLAGRRALEPGAVMTVGTKDGGFYLAHVSSRWALAFTRPESLERCLADAEESTADGTAMATDVTSLYAGYALLGPATAGVLSRLTSFDTGRLSEGACVATRVAEIPAIVIRPAIGGSPVELFVGSEYARYAWEAILDAGADYGIRPAGWDALRAEEWW
jgi:glycine cleavage system T protein (aminomethyltransferase)